MTRTFDRTLREFGRSGDMVLVVLCAAGFALLAVASRGDLLSAGSLQTFLRYLAVPILIGLAQMVVLAVGQLNIAVGAIGGVAAALSVQLMAAHRTPMALALLLGLTVATASGALNGLLVVATRINGFVVTLATMTILLGVQYWIIGTATVSDYAPALREWGNSAVLGVVPVVTLVALAVAVLVAAALRYTVSGRHLLAVGGNPMAARLSGLSPDRAVVVAHTASGAILGIAAVLTVASAPAVNQSVGGDWLLPSFAAPIIGGAILTGGSAAVLGTVLAAFVIRLVDTARAQFQLSPSWVPFLIGVVVLGAVVLRTVRQRRTDAAGLPAGTAAVDRSVT